MKNWPGFFLLFLFFFLRSFSQQPDLGKLRRLDSLTRIYTNNKEAREIAYSLKIIGGIYNGDNNIEQALDYYNRSLQVYEEINDKEGIANSLFNIGKIYNIQQDRKRGLSYRDKSIKIQEQVREKMEAANALNRSAYNYNERSDAGRALDNYYKSLKIYLEINDKPGIINSLNNIGTIYLNKGDKKQGLAYYDLSLKIKKESKKRNADIKAEINNPDRIACSFNNIAAIYLDQKNYTLAHAYSDSALLMAKKLRYPNSICKAESLLTKIDSATANLFSTTPASKKELLSSAGLHHKQYILYRDSVRKPGLQKAFVETQQAAGKPVHAKTGENAGNINRTILFIIIPGGLFLGFAYICIRIFGKNK
jgi:tetratricopeptide (TPR) repeat protein